MKLLRLYAVGENGFSTEAEWQVVRADSRWYGPAMMSNGRDGLLKGILMYTYESVEALGCCIRV